MRWIVALTAMVVAASACSGGADAQLTDPARAESIPDGAVAVPFQPLDGAATPMSGIVERLRLVIRDGEAWDALWEELAGRIAPRPEAPAVDFTTHMVVAAAMGQQTSGGYAISVEAVAERGDTLYALVQETTPGAGCLTATVLTAPAAAVVVPRHDGPVAFVEEEVARPCAP